MGVMSNSVLRANLVQNPMRLSNSIEVTSLLRIKRFYRLALDYDAEF